MNNNKIKVISNKINKIHFFFTCPLCNKRHKHGSNKDLSNRVEYRSPHCDRNINTKEFEIYITDDTSRV